MGKPKRRSKEKKAHQTDIEYRPFLITESEAERLKGLVEKSNEIDPLIGGLDQIISDFNDNVKRIEEITIRETATAYWEEPEHWMTDRMAKDRERRKVKMNKQIACLQAKEMRRLLRVKEKEERRKQIKEYAEQRKQKIAEELAKPSGTNAESDLVQEGGDLGLAQTQEQASSLPTVMGNEGQQLKIGQGDGGGDGGTPPSTPLGSGEVLSPPLLE